MTTRERIINDSTSVSPGDLGAQLWHALAALVCARRHMLKKPCPECLQQTFPLVRPIARALVIAGKRGNNYDLVGRAVRFLLHPDDKEYRATVSSSPVCKPADEAARADSEREAAYQAESYSYPRTGVPDGGTGGDAVPALGGGTGDYRGTHVEVEDRHSRQPRYRRRVHS